MLSTLKALAVEQQVGHLLAEHQHDSWSDPDCERERRRVARAAKEHQSLQEREKEETLIIGEVFCSSCHECFVGYKFKGHKAGCRELPLGVDRVEVLHVTMSTGGLIVFSN